jgi:hypothetical protein
MEIHTEKTIWYYKSENFTVEVCVWKDPKSRESLTPELCKIIPEYHWHIYCHIFPKHPLFNKIVNNDFWDYGLNLPLHCGSTYNKWDYDAKGVVVAKHIGCDYQHCDDDRFGLYATKEDASEVFRDADMLIDVLDVLKKNK